ncbi:MAG: xylose isomerase domain-containing [Geobacteraceae bacterium]|nr:MAG: xylose isomerase domain-containing [Geobacteraceae bacterium]
MNNPVFAHVPYHLLEQNLEYVLARRINPEVFFSGDALDSLIPEELAAIAGTLTANGIRTTIHTPFMDLNPGSVEHLIREATLRRFNQALDAAEILKPVVMVFHPGYDRWRYGESQDKWLKHSIDTWRVVLERAAKIGCVVAVENIFEEEPSTLRALFEAVDSPDFRHCFDVGHWNLFKKVGMEEWFASVGSYIAETHIHDNFGLRDDHLPIGEGEIDFNLFFSLLKRYAPDAVCTIEAHSREKVEKALQCLDDYLK